MTEILTSQGPAQVDPATVAGVVPRMGHVAIILIGGNEIPCPGTVAELAALLFPEAE